MAATIGQAVGIRNRQTPMPNQAGDIRTVTGLLDRIPGSKGGTQDIPGNWSTDRTALINEVTAAIVNTRFHFESTFRSSGGLP